MYAYGITVWEIFSRQELFRGFDTPAVVCAARYALDGCPRLPRFPRFSQVVCSGLDSLDPLDSPDSLDPLDSFP